MTTISNYKKHLKLSERIKIENALNNNMSFRSVSRDINKGVTTISREIVNRRYKEKGNYFNGLTKKCEKLEKESREGIDQTTDEFKELNKIVKHDVDNGHSFALIINNHPELNISERTLYNYQEQGYLDTKNIDLPRKVRYKKKETKTR